jgi:hypothetical protein
VDPYQTRDQILGGAIDGIAKGEKDAAMGPLVGGAIGDIEKEAREKRKKARNPATGELADDAKAMASIKEKQKNNTVTPADLWHARTLNDKYRAERDKCALQGVISASTAPPKGPIKSRL